MLSFHCVCGVVSKRFQFHNQHLLANEHCMSAIKPDDTKHPKCAKNDKMMDTTEKVMKE